MSHWPSLILAAIFIALLAYYIDYNEKHIRNLQEEVHRCRNDLKNMKQQLFSKQKEDFKNMEKEMDRSNSDLDKVDRQISSLTEVQSDMRSMYNHMESDLEKVDGQVSSLAVNQSDMGNMLKHMESELNEVKERLLEVNERVRMGMDRDISDLEKVENQMLSLAEEQSSMKTAFENMKSEMPLSCKKGWNSFNGNCYYIGNDRKSWSDSQDFCKSMGSNLVKIDDYAEHLWLKSIMKERKTLDMWIGANDFINKGVWTWVSDSSRLSFTKWVPGEPNNYHNVEHCAQITGDTNYDWNDTICDRKINYVCKIGKKA